LVVTYEVGVLPLRWGGPWWFVVRVKKGEKLSGRQYARCGRIIFKKHRKELKICEKKE